ncbi:MAG: cyclic nucleotide-binding domain-containing protein [Panacagrimonas sp.]
METESYRIAIIGSGPAGISAACRAAEMGDSHVLLEEQSHLSHTVFRYQKRKHVMAEPNVLPLRAATAFEAGTRERILEVWNGDTQRHKVNVRFRSAVTRVEKLDEGFRLTLSSGSHIVANKVVLSIGVQGNPNLMRVPGEDLPNIQYQLDDPDEYRREAIVVVGAGDAAIENAVALARQNTVHIVNRKNEFSRAKEGNNALILQAIDQGRVKCHYDSVPESVTALPDGHPSHRRMMLKLNSKEGVVELACDRIIARLGATPPRAFVESCGVMFPSKDPGAIPQISPTYESNVPGLYIIGALAGYPLIKQAMNQGYEVVEFIQGRPVKPADEPILEKKFLACGMGRDVEVCLDIVAQRSPVLEAINRLQLRELLLESRVLTPAEGKLLYSKGDSGHAVYVVVSGEVLVRLDENDPLKLKRIGLGGIVGEMALISGQPRTAGVVAGHACVLIEIPRRAMLKLIAGNVVLRNYIDRVFATNALERYLLPGAEEWQLREVLESVSLGQFKAGETIQSVGDEATQIHLIRSGSVTLSARIAGRDVVLQNHAAGQYFGEVDVIAGTPSTHTARAAIKTEIIRIGARPFLELLARNPKMRETVRARFLLQIRQREQMERNPERGARMHFLLQEGLGEATDVLLIDEKLCIRCDQCEKACASTHGNVSRLDREAGATFDNLHVPTSCRHCEHPHCMKDCPPDAIHRAPGGEVFIDQTCIGCGNCERNCPYGVIQMGVATPQAPSLWRWLVLGKGPAPGSDIHDYPKDAPKKALKCDMCGTRAAGPACVQACPTGAAIRVKPKEFFEVLAGGGR